MQPKALRKIHDMAAEEWAAFHLSVFTPSMGWVTGSVLDLESIAEYGVIHLAVGSGDDGYFLLLDVAVIKAVRIVGLA